LIKNEYDTAIIRPSYVLLLGDAELIPTFYPAANGDVGSATIGSDWQYAVYGDPVTDRIPDFAVGRIPVDTLDQANIVVNKIIAYEQTPPNNIAFYANAAIASQFQCCRTDVTQAGTDQRTFIEASEFARDVMVGQGKTVARIYTRTIDGAYTHDATPRRYFDGTLLPAALGPGYAWNGTTVDIVNAYNAGRFLMIHRDHGGPNAWIHPGFGVTEASGLTNGNLTPVVFSVNCASGLWDNETAGGALGTSGTAVYLAETLLRKSGGGAVGVLGDTRNSPSWPNSDLLRGFIDAIWPTALPVFGDATPKRRLGDILNHGKLYMMTRASVADADDENRLWHCIGDPTMEIYVRNPYRFVLSSSIWSSMLKNSLLVDYPVDGVSITAFQQNPTGGDAIPIGRGTVVDGIATLPFVNEPNEKLSFTYVVNADDLPPLIIQK